jgi:hypothetical protein
MRQQPTSHFGGKPSIKQVVPLPTASLLAYWDAGLTASYSASGQQTWFDLSGNGYHLQMSGSGVTYVTASGASGIYQYSPALDFYAGPFPGTDAYFVNTGSALCNAFNPTSSGYLTLTSSLCAPGPLYLDNVDYTILFYGLAVDIGGGLAIGDKVSILQRSFPTDVRVLTTHEKTNPVGSTGGTIQNSITPTNTFNRWNLITLAKECSGSSGGFAITREVASVYENPYITASVAYGDSGYPSVPSRMKAANNLLTGSGETRVGSDWRGYIQAVAIYNKVLTPTELRNAIDYFQFRKLN